MTFSMLTKDKSMTLEDFQSQLLGHERLLEHQAATTEHTSFAMFSIKEHQPSPSTTATSRNHPILAHSI
jgi:hypothetical protein